MLGHLVAFFLRAREIFTSPEYLFHIILTASTFGLPASMISGCAMEQPQTCTLAKSLGTVCRIPIRDQVLI